MTSKPLPDQGASEIIERKTCPVHGDDIGGGGTRCATWVPANSSYCGRPLDTVKYVSVEHLATAVAEANRLAGEVERLKRVIDNAYEAACEFTTEPETALTCVVEWLEGAVTPLDPAPASDDQQESTS